MPEQVPPELKARVLRAVIPALIAFLALSAGGFYFLLTDKTYPGIACFLAGAVLVALFHRWTRSLPPPYGQS